MRKCCSLYNLMLLYRNARQQLRGTYNEDYHACAPRVRCDLPMRCRTLLGGEGEGPFAHEPPASCS